MVVKEKPLNKACYFLRVTCYQGKMGVFNSPHDFDLNRAGIKTPVV